jgi:hypothetical protein
MDLFLHDDTPAKPGEKHGEDGPTHAGTVHVDYAYQVEEWVYEVQVAHPAIVRLRCPDLGREWLRGPDGKFVETAPSKDATG